MPNEREYTELFTQPFKISIMFGFDSEAYDSELTPEEYSKIRLDLLVFVDVMLDNNDFELESLEVLYDSFTAMIKETVPK